MTSFSTRLKFFRSLEGISQAELASRVGISGKQISDYEVGTSTPRKENFLKLLAALNVSEKEFMSSNCLFENSNNKNQSVTPIAIILSSELKGQLINIIGSVENSNQPNEISINIYSGTITRTKQLNENYVNVYYLTGDGEECICVNKERVENILKSMQSHTN